MTTDRARAILIAGHALRMTDDEIFTVAIDFLDLDVHPMSDLEVTIRGLFQGDDDFDDMIHELDHALGKCVDDSPDCPWNESPEEAAFYAAEAARGELAGSPDTMTCYACGGFNGHDGPSKKVVKLGRVVNEADPTQTYILECGHTTIAM